MTGCVRPDTSPALVGPSSAEIDQNNTVAAFMIARGESAMLELPVAGAYEAMSSCEQPQTPFQIHHAVLPELVH